MPSFRVETPQRCYSAVVERDVVARAAEYLPARVGKVFVLSTEDVWSHQGAAISGGLGGAGFELLHFRGGEERKRLVEIERIAEEMVRRGGDRSSLVIAFGGGVVNDMAGFVAAIFMRGIPVIQVPTTLLAQVDAGIGGKTGVNLVSGKNLLGSFHQPLVVLIDPSLLETLPEREYRAGLYEVLKAGVIRDAALWGFLSEHSAEVLGRSPEAVDRIIAAAVAMKCDVVTADEKEGDLRRILNFGHTFGHALEAETEYRRFLHGEAVAWGMRAAVYLAEMTGYLSAEDSVDILETLRLYGPIPPMVGISEDRLAARLAHDKKTVKGAVHFVLPVRIGEVTVVSGVEDRLVREAIRTALQ